MNTLYQVQARTDELRRRAEQERLAIIVRAGRPSRAITFYQDVRNYLGQGLIWLGSRLQAPFQQPATVCKTTPAGNATLVLSECC